MIPGAKVMLTSVGYVTSEDGNLRLVDLPVCHGYACCCVCADCLERTRLAAEPVVVPAQPWVPKAAA